MGEFQLREELLEYVYHRFGVVRLVGADIDAGCPVGQSHVYQQLILMALVEACFGFDLNLHSLQDFCLIDSSPYDTAVPDYILVRQAKAYAVFLGFSSLHKLNSSFTIQMQLFAKLLPHRFLDLLFELASRFRQAVLCSVILERSTGGRAELQHI